jgi:hypothetical protein
MELALKRTSIAIAIIGLVFLRAATGIAQAGSQSALAQLINSGNWTIQPPAKDGSVNFGLSYPATLSNNTDFVPLSRLGLAADVLNGVSHAIDFELKTEAGTFACHGKVANGDGGGKFAFEPDAAYATAYDAVFSSPLTQRQQVQAGMFDVSVAYVTSVAKAGFGSADFDTLLSMKIFRVTPEFLQALHADFPATAPSDVIGTWMMADKEHVDLHALHLDFPTENFDAITALAVAGVSPAYVAALKAAGVQGLTADGVATLRLHGVNQAFVDRLARNGPRGLSIDDVVRLKESTP